MTLSPRFALPEPNILQSSRLNVGQREIVAFVEQWRPRKARGGVGEAIPEIQGRGMAPLSDPVQSLQRETPGFGRHGTHFDLGQDQKSSTAEAALRTSIPRTRATAIVVSHTA